MGEGLEKSLEELEREITCAICQDHYTEPKVLPCCHYYCKQCVLKLSLKAGIDKPLSCPECRKETTLPDGNIDNLPTAFFINRLKDTYSTLERCQGKVEVKCELCIASGEKAVAFCRECAEFICEQCAKSHLRMKTFTEHEVVSLQKLKEGEAKRILPKEPPTNKCLVHEEPLTMFCFDCNTLICHHCTIKDHRDHNFDFIRTAAPKMKNDLIEQLEPLKKVNKTLSQHLEKIQTTTQEIKAQDVSLANTIAIAFDELHQILEIRKKQLLEEVAIKTREKVSNLSSQEEEISITNAAVQSVIDYTEQCVTHCADSEVMSMHAEIRRQIEREIEEHGKPMPSMEPVEEVDIGVEVRCAEALQQLCQSNVKVTQLPIDPSKSTASSEGTSAAYLGEVHVSNATVSFRLSNSKPTKRVVAIDGQLQSLVDGSILKCTVDRTAGTKFCIQYTPIVRGRHKLTLSVNEQEVAGSPFSVFVSIPPTQLGLPVKVMSYSNTPIDITVNSIGEIIVAEEENDFVVLNKDGEKIRTIEKSEHQFKHVQYTAVDSEDNIYFTDSESNRIYKSNKNCTFVQRHEVEQIAGPGHLGLTIVGDEVMVCETYNQGMIIVYDRELNYVRQIVGKDVGTFYDISYDRHGNLYTIDCDSDCITVFNNEGELLFSFSYDINDVKRLCGACGVCVAGEFVYVTNSTNHDVAVFTTEGEYVTSFGQCGKEKGEFTNPYSVSIDKDGFVYVSDFSCRIQVF